MGSTEEDLAAEEAFILRGWVYARICCYTSLICIASPQPNNLKAYKEALDRLNANIAFKSNDRDTAETVRVFFLSMEREILIFYCAGSSRGDRSKETHTTLHYHRR